MSDRADAMIRTKLLEGLGPDQLYAMARKAKESDHAGEREAFAAHLKRLGHDPDTILARGASSASRKPTSSAAPNDMGIRPRYARSRRGGAAGGATPKWAWAGYAGGMPPSHDIYRRDYTDLNYIKKRMYELSAGKRRAEHTVHQFDGGYFRNSFTTFGHESIHPEMAKAMLQRGATGNAYDTKAIFASRRNNPREMHLIWANGKHMPPGTIYRHEGRNQSVYNDPQAREKINAFIDKHSGTGGLKEGVVVPLRPRSSSKPMKSRLNSTQTQTQSGYEKQIHATMLSRGFISAGAPRDGTPGALYAGNHPSRDGRKLLLHSRPDGDWTTWQTINGTGDDTKIAGMGNGHASLMQHLKQWGGS